MKSAFDYWIARDPMRVTDEYIFGVWSKERNDWDSKGVFDYDKYSKELSKVIEAVKVNNYTLAKDELLAYYRKSDKKNKIKPNPKSIEHCLMSYEALKRNIYSVCKMNGMVMGFFNAEEELDWHSIDVKRSIKSLVLGSNAMVSYHLVSVDKTEVFAEFYSRKSEFVPYLELVVNGMPVKVNCFKDTMVRGGDKSSVNYSSEQVFKVRESGCYHNHDANMHRAYFVFDVNFLKPDDVVESATLNVYGKSQKGTKEICVYNEFEAGWKEDTFCWDNVTDELIFSCSDMNTWDFITSSATVIKGKICFYHRADELSVIAHLYKVSKNEEHAYTFLRNAMGLVHHVGCSREVFNELDMARYTDNLPRDIFNTIDSQHMTGERFVALFKNVYSITKWLIENFYGKKINNWASYATSGVYSVLGFFPEIANYEEWHNKTCRENDRIIKFFKNPDGSNIELGQCYQWVLITSVLGLHSTYEMTGVTMPLSDNSYDVLHDLLKHYYYTLSPTGSDYNIADTTDPFADLRVNIKKIYEMCPRIVGDDEELMYIITDGKKGKLPDFTTINFPYNLRTYMKTDWSKDALAMVVNGRREGSHGHEDVFSIAMMGYGRHLVTDQGYGAQLTGGIREMMKASSSHNVVLADNAENTWRKDSKQLGFDSNDKFDYCEFSGANNEIIDVQNRSVTFCKEGKFWIVTDYVKPKDCKKVTKYTQYWHMLPEAKMSIGENNVLRSNFDEGANVLIIPVGEIESSEIVDSKYSPGSGVIVDSKKAKLIKNKQGEVLFTTIIIPVNEGESFKVETKCTDYDNVNSFTVKITDKDGVSKTYCFAHSNNEVREIVAGDYKTTGVTMVVCEDEDKNVISRYEYKG